MRQSCLRSASAHEDGQNQDASKIHAVSAARVMLVDQVLQDVWSERDGFGKSESENAQIFQQTISGEHSSTYGEITPAGFRALATSIQLCPADAFVDLGSGVGRCVVQACLEFGCYQSHGIELSPSRHIRAQRALHDVMLHGGVGAVEASLMQGVRLVEGNLLDMPIADATVCWIASLCFSDDMMRTTADKLQAQGQKLRVVATLKPFPDGLKGFGVAEHQYEMSWTAEWGRTCKVYIYTANFP